METKLPEWAGSRRKDEREIFIARVGPWSLVGPMKGREMELSLFYVQEWCQVCSEGQFLLNLPSNRVREGGRWGFQQQSQQPAVRAILPGRPQQELLEAGCLVLSSTAGPPWLLPGHVHTHSIFIFLICILSFSEGILLARKKCCSHNPSLKCFLIKRWFCSFDNFFTNQNVNSLSFLVPLLSYPMHLVPNLFRCVSSPYRI